MSTSGQFYQNQSTTKPAVTKISDKLLDKSRNNSIEAALNMGKSTSIKGKTVAILKGAADSTYDVKSIGTNYARAWTCVLIIFDRLTKKPIDIFFASKKCRKCDIALKKNGNYRFNKIKKY